MPTISELSELGANWRGINYGDGFFETLHFSKSHHFRLIDYHTKRIIKASNALGFGSVNNQTIEQLIDYTHKTVLQLPHNHFACKWLFVRQSDGRYCPTTPQSVKIYVHIAPAEFGIKPPISVCFSIKAVNVQSAISAFKTTSALKYVVASLEAQQNRFDDVIILDHQQNLSEASASCLFFKTKYGWFTPSLKTGCIEGVMRNFIIDNLGIEEIELNKADLNGVEQMFLCNALGFTPIKNVEDKILDTTSTIEFINQIYNKYSL